MSFLASHVGSTPKVGRMDSLLTAEDVAELLGVTPGWVYEQSRRGCIPTVTLGRYRRYRAEAIADWVGAMERDSDRVNRSSAGRV